MAVTLSSLAGAGAQFFDNNGVPLAGGLIYTYLAGTNTPAVTYTSSTGLIAHANPIVLDSAGRITTGEIWLTSGIDYKFLVKTSVGVQLGSYDNIPSINDFTTINAEFADLANTSNVVLGDAMIGFRQSNFSGNLTNAVGRTVHQKLQESISVKDFGATGNGTTDDTAAIQSAINACGNNGGSIYLPAGTYKITSSININNQNGVRLFGDGYKSTIVLDSTTSDGIVVSGTSTGTILDSFWIVGSAAATAGNMIAVTTVQNPALFLDRVLINNGWNGLSALSNNSDVFIQNFLFSNQKNIGLICGGGIWANVGNINLSAGIGVKILSGLGPLMSNVDIFGCTTGVAINPSAGIEVGQARFVNVTCENGTLGWLIGGGGGNVLSVFMTNCNATNHTTEGVRILSGVNGVVIDNILASANTLSGINILDGSNVQIKGGFAGSNGGNGIGVAANVSNFSITGVVAGPSAGYLANQLYGILVAAGTSDEYIISLNNTRGNVLGGITDGGTGVNKVVANNLT